MYRRVLLKTRPACRSYVGLAFNEKKSGIETIDRSLKSFQRTAASVTNSTISQVGQDVHAETETEPSFEVVSAGVGSALLVKLPAESHITAATGSALGASSRVVSKLSLDHTTAKSIARGLLGDAMFYQKYYTKKAAGDILLAPQRLGEITTIDLKSGSKYILRRDAFLAKTEKVTFDLGLNSESGILNRLVHQVSGPGTLAISHYGGIYRISLGAGEEYQANPAHLIMWDKRTEPTRLFPDHPLVPSPRSSLRQYTFIKNIVDSPSFQPKLQYMNRVSRSLRNFIMGTPDFVKLKGPGDFYLTSRVEPRLERSKLMNALAAANDSATQMFENAAIFPPGAEPEPFVPAPKKGKHPGYAQVSTNGQPSFYAQVGPNGVSFVSSE